MKGFEPLWRSLALENPRCVQEFVKANGFTDQEVNEGNIMKQLLQKWIKWEKDCYTGVMQGFLSYFVTKTPFLSPENISVKIYPEAPRLYPKSKFL